MKKWTDEQKLEFVKRCLAGESVVSVAKDAKASRAWIYVWIREFKAAVVTAAKTANMSAASIAMCDLRDLKIENSALKCEVSHLKQKVFHAMYEAGQI